MSKYTPVRVTARLSTGFVTATPWGIALDGLLAAELWADQKARTRADGDDPGPGLHAQDNPPDLELPLARCHRPAELWHWAATCSFPIDQCPGQPPEVRYWTARVDQRATAQISRTIPATVSESRGRYRARRMPALATVCRAVTWYAVGDPEAIAALVEPIVAIGKRRGVGEGHVLAWELATAPDLHEFTAAHLHPNGTLGRPTPAECLAGTGVAGSMVGTAGLRPPYMHRSRQHQLHTPALLENHD